MGRVKDEGARGTYHHGDLRHTLIEVGEQLLGERGLEGFTLRECARRAGVSPSAPSHHFGNVAGLFTAIATAGFDGLTAAQEAALAEAGADPKARLRSIGMAYIRHAVDRPARFRVMFDRVPIDWSDPGLVAAAKQALGVLIGEIHRARGGIGTEADRDAGVALAWAAVHGFAQLLIDGRLAAAAPTLDPAALIDDLAARGLEMLVAGLTAR